MIIVYLHRTQTDRLNRTGELIELLLLRPLRLFQTITETPMLVFNVSRKYLSE